MVYHNRRQELLLPLATSLDEPEDFAALFNEFEKPELKTLLMQVELVNKPGDFFFKLATYLDQHLYDFRHLWRSGAILHFYGSKETRALIEMPDNVLSLKVSGKDQKSFQQLLVSNIIETLKSYDNISALSSERIWLEDGKSEMLSSDVIASLTSGTDTLKHIQDQLMEKASKMTTYNIGNVTGNIGDGNKFINEGDIYNQTINIDSLGKDLISELRKLSGVMPGLEAQGVINESIKVLEEAVTEPDEIIKKSLFKKAVDLVKDVVVLEKATDLYTEYKPLAAGIIAKIIAEISK